MLKKHLLYTEVGMRSKKIFKTQIVIIFTFMAIIAMAVLTPVVCADIIPIASINDSYINKEVTVSGLVSMSSASGHKYILTVDDGSGTISVEYDARLLETPYGRQRITVTGIYAGKGVIYADKFGMNAERGYKDTTVAELKEFPEYYYGNSVRVKGNISKIVLTREKTELVINDDTGEINVVLYGVEMEDLKIDDKVVVEGKCYKTTISAFAIKVDGAELTNQTLSNQPDTSNPVTPTTPTPRINPAVPPSRTSTPAFQIIPAIVALLAAAYLLRRRK
jgi:cytochrome c-type biogenesis protein CcmE